MNAKKTKQGCGCKMCKPHQGKWAHKFKKAERVFCGTNYITGEAEYHWKEVDSDKDN